MVRSAFLTMVRPFLAVVEYLTSAPRALAGLATARIGVAVAQLSLYVSDYSERSFLFGGQAFDRSIIVTPGLFSLYDLAPGWQLWFEVLYHLGAFSCLLMVLGMGGRWTIAAVFVTCWSIWNSNPMVIDGGDNLAMIVIPLLFLSRCCERFSLRTPLARIAIVRRVNSSWPVVLLNNAAAGAIMVQICIVYFMSGMYKAAGEMWIDGTALYYILRTPEYFYPPLTPWVLENDLVLVVGTQLSVVMLVAFPFLVLSARMRPWAVMSMLLFHLGIAVLMGLTSFALIMAACDSVFVSRHIHRGAARARDWAMRAVPALGIERRRRPRRHGGRIAAPWQAPSPGALAQTVATSDQLDQVSRGRPAI